MNASTAARYRVQMVEGMIKISIFVSCCFQQAVAQCKYTKKSWIKEFDF